MDLGLASKGRRIGLGCLLVALTSPGCAGRKRDFAEGADLAEPPPGGSADSDPDRNVGGMGSGVGADPSDGSNPIPGSFEPPSDSRAGASVDAGVKRGPVLESPSSLAFGGIVIGGETALSVNVVNSGDSAMPPVSTGVMGEQAAEYSIVDNGCNVEIAPGASCVIVVRFLPGSAGERVATLVLTTSVGGSATLQLSGNGLQPGAVTIGAADGSSPDFGGVLVGSSRELTFAVSNPGDLDAGVLVVESNSADYIILPAQPGECASGVTRLGSGASCTLRVAFSPTIRGPVNGALTAGTESAGNASLNLNGVGLAPARLVSAITQADLGSGEVGATGSTFDWVLTNEGDVASDGASLVNTNGNEFAVQNGCSGVLAAGASCIVQVTFSPQQAGERAAVLTLSSSAGVTTLEAFGNARVRLTITKNGVGTVTSSSGIGCGSTCSGLFDVGDVVALQADTANGTNSLFTGWSATECAGPSRRCEITITSPRTIEATFAALSNNVVFFSSEVFPTTLGGVGPYDAACNRLATAAGINSAGGDAFIALLSDSTSNALERLSTAQGWIRMDGRPFSGTQDQLFQNNTVYYPAVYDELGEPVPDDSFNERRAMTGTSADGSTDVHCDSWAANSTSTASFGLQSAGPGSWVARGRAACDAEYHLICMGRSRTAALVLPTSSGKRIWLTNTGYEVGGPLTPDAKCLSERPGGVAGALALIAYTDRPASAALQPGVNYVRSDGQLVGTGEQIAARQVLTGIWQNADGSYRAPVRNIAGVNTGSQTLNDVGTVESTCNDWSALMSSTTDVVGSVSAVNFNWWFRDRIGTCGVATALYCVEP
jgi:hypothetical protein